MTLPLHKQTEHLSVIYSRATVKKQGCPGLTLSVRAKGLLRSVLWETYSKSQHFVVLGIHGFAFFSPTPGDIARVRLCIKCNPPQFEYNVSLSLRETDSQKVNQLTKGSKGKKEWWGLGRTLAAMDL